MNKFFVFNKACIGYLHIKKNLPVEDYSLSFEADNFKIIVIADGHGAKSCFRSAKGSEFITEITSSSLKEFAETALSSKEALAILLLDTFERKHLIKRLTDSILYKWSKMVEEDLTKNPLSDEEKKVLVKITDDYNYEHIYGTTLIASLLIGETLILLQQGDGKCTVFFADETIENPIPWDERCFANVTTSICDVDAAYSIRHSVIDVSIKGGLLACCIGSDGIDDSYKDDEGCYNFYKELMLKLYSINFDATKLEEYLTAYLPKFTEFNSGDDISIACIINKELFNDTVIENFAKSYLDYQLRDELLTIENKLISMERKLSILENEVIRNMETTKLESTQNETTKEISYEVSNEITNDNCDFSLVENKNSDFITESLGIRDKTMPLEKDDSDLFFEYSEYKTLYQKLLSRKKEIEQKLIC